MRRRPKLTPLARKLIGRTWLVIRIPDAMAEQLCLLVECQHDHPRRVAYDILRKGIAARLRRGKP